MTSSLVVQTSFIGDVILTTPLIAKLAETGDVDVVTTRVGATVLANNPAIRRVIVYDKQGTERGIAGFVRATIAARRQENKTPDATTMVGGRGRGEVWHNISQLGRSEATHERGRWDKLPPDPDRHAYLAQGSLRSAALVVAAGYRARIGFDTSSGRGLYTRRVSYHSDWHHARRLLSLADEKYAENVDSRMLQPRLYPSNNDVVAVDTLLGERTRPLVALAPGSVWGTKRWPYYGELGRRLSEDFDVVVVGGSGDAEAAAEVMQRVAPERIVDAIGKLSLLRSAELLRRAVLVVTNDSAPQHLASAMGTPTVTVFGPTVPDFGFGPLAPRSRVVGHDTLACRPCDRHGPQRCPLGHWKCMRDVSVDEVYRVAQETVSVRR